MIAQELEKIPSDPVLVADFQRKLEFLRQAFQKWPEQFLERLARRKDGLIKIGKLQQQRAKAIAEQGDARQKIVQLRLAVFEHPFVGDDAGDFCSKHEARWCLIAPA